LHFGDANSSCFSRQTDDAYKRLLDFCKTRLCKFNIDCTVVKMCDYAAIQRVVRKNTRLFLSESATNPYLNVSGS
jgi:cystathionine gamma-synthase